MNAKNLSQLQFSVINSAELLVVRVRVELAGNYCVNTAHSEFTKMNVDMEDEIGGSEDLVWGLSSFVYYVLISSI